MARTKREPAAGNARESSIPAATSVAKRIVREGIDFAEVTTEVERLQAGKFDKLRKALGKAGMSAVAIDAAVAAAVMADTA